MAIDEDQRGRGTDAVAAMIGFAQRNLTAGEHRVVLGANALNVRSLDRGLCRGAASHIAETHAWARRPQARAARTS